MNEMKQAIVLAAGRSRRMEHLSNKEPKCLLPYRDESILKRLVRQLKQNGIEKIVVTAGYRASSIHKMFNNEPGVEIVENRMYEEDVNILSMNLALVHIQGACGIFEADTVLEDDLVKYIVGSDFEKRSVWFTKGKFKPPQYGAILRSDRRGNVTDLQIISAYHDRYKHYSKITGVMRISANEIELFRALVSTYSRNTIKQYYLVPWIENLKLLPCMEADISPFAFFTFNKPEEYYQVRGIDVDSCLPAPPIVDCDVSLLRGIEEFDQERVNVLESKIRKDGHWMVPVVAEVQHHLVLDGQHRLEVARRLGIKRIPVIFVRYDEVQVWTLRKEEKVSPNRVIARVNKGSIYPYKTVKHKFNFKVPQELAVPLASLAH